MSLTSIHRPEIDKKSQGNKKAGKVRSFSAPSGEANGIKEHKNKPARFEPVEGRNGQQAVASATGSIDKTRRKPSFTPYEENTPEAKQKSAPTEEQKRNYPVARGLIRQHMDEVELDLPEETKEPSSPTPVPATATAQNVPAAPYPVVYLTMKSTDGTDVQVPYLNTPNGLVPWITQAPQQAPSQISEAKRTVEEGNVVPFVPQVKSHVNPVCGQFSWSSSSMTKLGVISFFITDISFCKYSRHNAVPCPGESRSARTQFLRE